MFVFLVAYRANGTQTFRREQLSSLIENINVYFNKHMIEYKIMIIEQKDDDLFNRGKLLNVAFLESEKIFKFPKKYFHMNTDYLFDLNRDFPSDLFKSYKGFIDLYRPPFDVLGAACVFDAESYTMINGFPNDLLGWGGDDWAIYNRIKAKQIPIYYPKKLHNCGFIIEDKSDEHIKDRSQNKHNGMLAKRNDISTNGLSTCTYNINKHGEFHCDNIYHYVVDLNVVKKLKLNIIKKN